MKLSELRDLCNKYIESHGDINVYNAVQDGDYGEEIDEVLIRDLEKRKSKYVRYATALGETLIAIIY